MSEQCSTSLSTILEEQNKIFEEQKRLNQEIQSIERRLDSEQLPSR